MNPSDAAKQLGVSAKALRLYEDRGLISPGRTAAGWRAYGPEELARATQIVELRALGLSLNEVARILGGDVRLIEGILAVHEVTLGERIHRLNENVLKVQRLRSELSRGVMPAVPEIARWMRPPGEISISFDLPWPWDGERFELRDIRPLNHIVGPLGSGKTRLLMRLVEALGDADFIGMDRLGDGGASAKARLNADPELRTRVDRALASIVDYGGSASTELVTLLTSLETERRAVFVIDMLEQGLDAANQEALITFLRRRGPAAKRLIFTTRSNVILDLEAAGGDEAIVLCPANHSPPTRVAPFYGTPGYEAVATCLASPEVRARTEGLIAWRRCA
jgi:DNA-binding transcriptional MerR regulator